MWRPPYAQWIRRSPCWGPITTTLGYNPMARSSLPSNSSSRPIPKPIHQPLRSTPSPGLIELGVQLCRASATARDRCIADMITIDFFFLYRPGEHTITYDNEPFKLSNVEFYLLDQPVRLDSPLLQQSDFMTLTFDTQKNGTKGEKIGHGCSTSKTLCPIHAVALQVQHLLAHGACCSHQQPLCSCYFDDASNRFHYIESSDITTVLLCSAMTHNPGFCVDPTKVECRSLRTSGAMAL